MKFVLSLLFAVFAFGLFAIVNARDDGSPPTNISLERKQVVKLQPQVITSAMAPDVASQRRFSENFAPDSDTQLRIAPAAEQSNASIDQGVRTNLAPFPGNRRLVTKLIFHRPRKPDTNRQPDTATFSRPAPEIVPLK